MPDLRGARSKGLRPICVRSMYLSSAPVAASSGALKIAEAAKLLDAERGFQIALAGSAVEIGRRHGRCLGTGDLDPA